MKKCKICGQEHNLNEHGRCVSCETAIRSKDIIESGPLYRDVTIRKDAIIDEDARRVRLSFSSEEPVERFFGLEILDHTKGSIRLDRFNSGSANLLMDHKPSDVVGVIESVEVDSKAGKAFVTVRFGKSVRATEIWEDVKGGIRTSVSVGYRVHKAIQEEQNSDSPDIFRVTDWEPFEVSLVSIPADATVGVGRSDQSTNKIEVERRNKMKKCNICGKEHDLNEHGRCVSCETVVRAAATTVIPATPVTPVTPSVSARDTAAQIKKIRDDETARMGELRAMGDEFKHVDGIDDMVRDGISSEKDGDWLRKEILTKIGKAGMVHSGDLGIKDGERQKYSLMRAIRVEAGLEKDGGFEAEVSRAMEDHLGESARGIFMPYDMVAPVKRDQNVGTDSAGGYLVETVHDAAGFIELLRNRGLVMAMGARALPGLVGNYTAPKQTAGATFYWITEGSDTTESQLTFGQIEMSPKTVSGRVDMTRLSLLQTTPSVEALVRDDLLTGIALEMDRVAINGDTSSDEPEGILNTTGIGSVIGGTDGAPIDWAKVVQLETEVAVDNAAIGALGYLTNTKVRGSMKTTEKAANTAQFLWPDTPMSDGFGSVNGYRAGVTNQVPGNLIKGTGINLSAMIFGNWSDLLIGMWGGLDLTTDATTLGDSGGLVVRIFQSMDTAVRHAESFSAMEDIITE